MLLSKADNSIKWRTDIAGFPSHHAQLLPNGSLVLQDENDNIGWSSNTLGNVLYWMISGRGSLKISNGSTSTWSTD